MQEAFVGVDVSFARGKRLPISICRWEEGRLIPFPLRELSLRPPTGSGNAAVLDAGAVQTFAREAGQYIEAVAEQLGVSLKRIGIDAPSSPCRTGRRRACEMALDQAGISCFATPTEADFATMRDKVREHLRLGRPVSHLPHANQLWMLVGFELFRQLSQLAECLEVFPQATVRAIGAGAVHKSRLGAVAEQARAVGRYTGWPNAQVDDTSLVAIAWGPMHDCLDAYLSAWVAALDEDQRSALGTPPDDVIWIPRLSEDFVASREAPRADQKTRQVRPIPAAFRRLCPACEAHEFKRWPWGWDAHAAHKCAGLSAQHPEERKREFRERFSTLFGRAEE